MSCVDGSHPPASIVPWCRCAGLTSFDAASLFRILLDLSMGVSVLMDQMEPIGTRQYHSGKKSNYFHRPLRHPQTRQAGFSLISSSESFPDRGRPLRPGFFGSYQSESQIRVFHRASRRLWRNVDVLWPIACWCLLLWGPIPRSAKPGP